jgi:flagellar protein FlgJ
VKSGAIAASGPATPPGNDEQRLRKAAAQMEGVFLGELLKALRETVPEGGVIDGGSAESIFTEMMDAHLAEVTAARQSLGLGDALFRQLRTLLSNSSPAQAAGGES